MYSLGSFSKVLQMTEFLTVDLLVEMGLNHSHKKQIVWKHGPS